MIMLEFLITNIYYTIIYSAICLSGNNSRKCIRNTNEKQN